MIILKLENLDSLIDSVSGQTSFLESLGLTADTELTPEQKNALYIAWRMTKYESIQIGHS